MADVAAGRGPLRFCLVTSAHVSNNPRLVKEADALASAGHDVRVVAPWQHAHLAERDDALLARRRWRLTRVEVGRRSPGLQGRLRWSAGALLERAWRAAFAHGLRSERVAARALSRNLGAHIAAVAAEHADVVIAHNLQALPVAGRAAARLGARLGFDIEDLHSGELPALPEHELQRELVSTVERHWLPRCSMLTASSEGIADEIVRLYGVRRPAVVLNVFPHEEAAHRIEDPTERPAGARVSLYWYSQVIGRGRGIEEAVAALAMLDEGVHLTLRGESDPDFVSEISAEARRTGVIERLHLKPASPPGELVARAACHDVGLALEQPNSLNRELCVTNKLFTYMLAGLAIAATDTAGQRGILKEAAGVGFLCPPGDAHALAEGLRALTESPERLASARRRAADASRDRFNWERERAALVACLTGARTPDDSRTLACAAS